MRAFSYTHPAIFSLVSRPRAQKSRARIGAAPNVTPPQGPGPQVPGEGAAVGGGVGARRAVVRQARHRPALEILGREREGPADRGVRVVVGAERADPAVHPDLVADPGVPPP